MPASLPWRHFVLALAVVAVWGTNFAIIKVALGSLPPLLFAALRFALALVPAVFFLPRFVELKSSRNRHEAPRNVRSPRRVGETAAPRAAGQIHHQLRDPRREIA